MIERSFFILFLALKWPVANWNDFFSATNYYQIDLKPSCKFKFVRCLEVYLKKLINLDHEVTQEGLTSARVPQKQPCWVHFRVHLGFHEGTGGFPGPKSETIMRSNYCGSMKVQEGSMLQIMRELGSPIIGPCRLHWWTKTGFDPMGVGSCVPRVPWNVFVA